MVVLISFLWSLWCCVSLRVSGPSVETRVLSQLQSAHPDEYCNIVQSEGPYNADDKYYVAELVFKDPDIDSLEVLKCFVETMNLTLDDAVGPEDETLLFPAVKYKQLESLKYLIAQHVPVEAQDDHGWSAAMLAIGRCAKCLEQLSNKNTSVSEVRLREGCHGLKKRHDRCRDSFTLLHLAAQEDDLDAMDLLSRHNVDFNAIDSAGWNPVHVAVRYNRMDALEKLGTLNASFNIEDKSGRTPAHLACQYVGANLKRCFEIILQFHGRLGARDHSNNTPAHLCASATNEKQMVRPEGLQFLYDHASESFDQRGALDRTPAEVAQKEGNRAQLFFANLKARENAAAAVKLAEDAKINADKARVAEMQARLNEEKAERYASEQKLASALSEAADTCQKLSSEVSALFDCDVEPVSVQKQTIIRIRVPPGVMIASKDLCRAKNDIYCAMRCPNPLACPGGEEERQCCHGYSETSAGCSRCLKGYGRHRQDPFQCKECAGSNLSWVSWILYAIKPLGLYSVTLWTAQKVEKDKLASLLKIWMSFGVVVACISPSIKTSKTVTDVLGPHQMELVASGADFVSIATQLSGPSFDCLLENASMTAWLLLSFAPALALWVLSMIYAVGRRLWMQAEVDMLMRDALKVSIAITNCFLPDMVAALSRYFPCIHFQTSENYPQFLQYSVETSCSDVTGMRIVALFGAVLVGALGPLFWVAVIKKSDEWTEKYRKETLGFLVSGYRPEVYWWESTVLIRKCVVAFAAALFSLSYAPMLYLSSLLLIVGLSLAGHAFVQPYENKFLNRLEFATLVASFVAVFCTFILKLEALDWATDRKVTVFAFVILFVVVIVPGISLIALYFNEILKRDLRLDILGRRIEEDELSHPRSDAST